MFGASLMPVVYVFGEVNEIISGYICEYIHAFVRMCGIQKQNIITFKSIYYTTFTNLSLMIKNNSWSDSND